MRVLILVQAFDPDVAAVAQHATDLARHLAASGHEVVVLTSRAVYGRRGADLPAREIIAGVDIRRVGGSLFGKSALALRAADGLTFLGMACVRALALPRPDVVLSTTLPPFAHVAGAVIARMRGAAHACWVLDAFPDLAIAVGGLREGGFVAGTLERVEAGVLRRADLRVVMGRCMRSRLARHGVRESDFVVMPPWSDGREITVRQPRTGAIGRFVVMYSGNFGLAHDLDTLLDAAELLRDDERFAFLFVGGGKREAELRSAISRRRLKVQMRPHVPREQLAESLATGDVHLVTLRASALGVSVPSKLWGIMAAGRPAVVMAPEASEIARVVRENDCGLVLEPDDAAGLARVLRRLADDESKRLAMGRRGRAAFERLYERTTACATWERLLTGSARRARRVAGAG